MPDATDVVLTLTLAAIDTSAAAMAAFNARLAEQKALIDAANARAISGAKAVGTEVDITSAKYIAAQDRETAAAIKSADLQIAASQRVTMAVMREQDKQSAAMAAAASKRNAAGVSMLGTGVVIGAATLGASVVAASKYDDTLIKIRGNTGSTTAQIKEMDDAIQKMAATSPASINDIAAAFERAANMGYRGAAAVQIVHAAMEAAVATGGKVEDMMNLVGTAMRNSHQPASQAATDMNIFVKAAADSNVRLPDMANNFQKVGVMAASMHIPLADAAAAYATIAGSTHDAALAQTLMIGVMNKIMNPTSTIIKLMDQLKQSTGIDLVKAFAETAAGTMKLNDLMGLAAKATGGNTAELYKLFGGLRGGQGAVILATQQWDRYNQTLKDTRGAHNQIDASYQQMVGSVSGQTKILENNLNLLAISLGQTLTPAFIGLVQDITPVVKGIKDLNDESHGGVADVAKFGVAAGAAALLVLKIRDAFIGIKTAAEAARVAEIAAFAASPAGIAAAITAFAAYKANQLSVNENLDAMKAAEARLTTEFDKGNISTDQAKKILAEFNVMAKLGSGDVVDLTLAKLNDSKAKYQDHIKLEADAMHHLSSELVDGIGHWRDLTDAKKKYYQFDGKGAGALSPGAPATSGLVDLNKQIADAQDKVNKAVEVAAWDMQHLGHVTAAHQAQLDGYKIRLQNLQDELSSLTGTTDLYTAAIKSADDEVKRLTADQIRLSQEGLAKEQAAFQGMADSAISQAQRMRAGVVAEYHGMLATITKNIPMGTVQAPSETRTTFLGSNQFPTAGPAGSPAASSIALDPQLAASNNTLAATIKTFPTEFRAAWDSELKTFKSEEAALYKTYIHDLNAENKADAAAVNKINDDYHKKVAVNAQLAQDKLKTEHDRYLGVLDTLERNHNTQLQTILSTFMVNYQNLLVTYQAALGAAEAKARSDEAQHEDRLRQIGTDAAAQLAAVHGKDQGAQRAAILQDESRRQTNEDNTYNRTVSLNESYFKNLGIAFDKQVSDQRALFDRNTKKANDNLTTDLKTAKGTDKTALDGIQRWLDGKDTKAESDRQNALNKEAGIYTKIVNGIVEAFDKGGHLIAQHMLKDTSALGQVNTVQAGLQGKFDAAQAQVTLDIIKHGSATKADISALAVATKGLDDFNYGVNKSKNALSDLSVVAGFLGAKFGSVGQPAPGVPSIATTVGGGGFAATVPGIISGGIKLRDTFEQQVQAGLDQIRTSKEQERVNLEVAKRSGDVATQFSIISKEYYEGRKDLTDFLAITKENTLQLDDHRIKEIAYDQATGDTAAALKLITDQYHEGKTSLSTLTAAYNDNAAAVAKTTAQDLLFLESTGQWSAALSSISTSLTGPLGDATAKLTYDFLTHTGNIEADTKAVQDHQAALDALTQATWDASYTAANPATQSQMLNTLAQPMISQQSSEQSAAQAMNTAQLGVIAAESALEVQGINAMTTQIQDMSGIIKASSAVQTAAFSGQLAKLNDMIPIQNDLLAIQQATTPAMLQTAQEQLKIDRLTAAMDQDKASWDVKIAQMELSMAQDKMMVDNANADAQRVIAMDNLTLAGDALNVQVASAKLQSDSLIIQNAIHADLGGVQDYLNLIDGDLQNLSAAQDQQMSDQSQLGYDTGSANMIAAGGSALMGGDQLGIDSATAAATASNQAYQLQLAQYKVEQNSQQNLQTLVTDNQANSDALLSEIKTLQGIIAFQNSPASRRPLTSVGNVSTAAMINSWAATAASTQAA
jgi:TP901 family phage tail tape measure protein